MENKTPGTVVARRCPDCKKWNAVTVVYCKCQRS